MSTRGFSLLEVMIAMAILAIGILVSTPLLHYSIARSAEARKVTAAQLLGTQILERLRTEIRYDAKPANTPSVASFDLSTAWKADRLPYSSYDLADNNPPGPLTTCNPAGANDKQGYKVGPFRARYEGHDYFICYDLVASTTGAPGNSLDARVKVIWSRSNGWSARWISGTLLDGR